MAFDTVWRELRERSESLDPDAVFITPSTERVFTIDATAHDRFVIRYRETDDERTLWREQFEVLDDSIRSDGTVLSLDGLPSGVEPYVSVLSLSSRYVVDESSNELARAGDEDDGDGDEGGDVIGNANELENTNDSPGTDVNDWSPFVHASWEVRTTPERVRDDAVLLLDLLDQFDHVDVESLSPEQLVDLYVLLSDVQRGAAEFRRTVGSVLLDYVGPTARLHGQFGSVHRTHRDRRRLKDTDDVLAALDEEGIPHEWVLGIDSTKLDVVCSVTDLEEADVYDVDEQVYVQKTSVEEEQKQFRLQGLVERVDALDTEEAEELRDEIEQLEAQLDALLAAE